MERRIVIHKNDGTKEAKMEQREPVHDELESFVHACNICKEPTVTGEAGLAGLSIAQTVVVPCKVFCEG